MSALKTSLEEWFERFWGSTPQKVYIIKNLTAYSADLFKKFRDRRYRILEVLENRRKDCEA